ncbi:MAG: YHS domain-containing protein, partial [Verrucomicrobia bacterium]|nr:YHS domain-containing protein [Verrucomicrobiota bacterium]
MNTDPICGMTMDEATALHAERGGQTFYFCSEHCREKFLSQSALTSEYADHDGHEHKHGAKEHSCCVGKSQGDAHSHARHDHSHHGHDHAAVTPSAAAKYFCPMCPGVESDKPGDCPKCGMALERNPAWKPAAKTIYTCPMHPEIEQDHPGDCPKCGMALEPTTIVAEGDVEEDNSELRDMTRRFWIGGALALPVFVVAMAHLVPAWRHAEWAAGDVSRWGQFL